MLYPGYKIDFDESIGTPFLFLQQNVQAPFFIYWTIPLLISQTQRQAVDVIKNSFMWLNRGLRKRRFHIK